MKKIIILTSLSVLAIVCVLDMFTLQPARAAKIRNTDQLFDQLAMGAIYDAEIFPTISTNGVVVGGDNRLRQLLNWVREDHVQNPGKPFHRVSYSIAFGGGDPSDDIGKTFLLKFDNRTVLLTLLLGPQFQNSDKAFLVVDYVGRLEGVQTREFLNRECTLAWIASENGWRDIRESGPAPRDVRN